MKAMLLERFCNLNEEPQPLRFATMPVPKPSPGEILVKVEVCGVCHTEIDEIEGRTPPPHLPIILGHQVVGTVEGITAGVTGFNKGDRVGIAWIHSACGACKYCLSGKENLCEHFLATGRDVHGGYAEYISVPAPFAYKIPETLSSQEAAPLLCAGAIGYRSLRLTGLIDSQILGLMGFGASAHLVMKMVRYRYPYTRVIVFARKPEERAFALELGATWAGDIGDTPPENPDCIIDTTPVWKPVLESLRILEKGGKLVINAIRKEDSDKHLLASISYTDHLWQEKEIKSVANVSRKDVIEFLEIAGAIRIQPEVQTYPMKEANLALLEIKKQQIRGAKVLCIS